MFVTQRKSHNDQSHLKLELFIYKIVERKLVFRNITCTAATLHKQSMKCPSFVRRTTESNYHWKVTICDSINNVQVRTLVGEIWVHESRENFSTVVVQFLRVLCCEAWSGFDLFSFTVAF